MFGSKPTALLFLLQCKQVRLLKCSFVTPLGGAQAFTLTRRCLRTLFFFGDSRAGAVKTNFFWGRLALCTAIAHYRVAWHITKRCFTLYALSFCKRLPLRSNLHRGWGQSKQFWRRGRARRTTASKQVHKHLNGRTGSAAEGTCFARALKDRLVDVVATLDKVLCDARTGFLCGFFAAGAQCAYYPVTESLHDLFAEITA